jgi:hypothetical protein
MLKQLADSVYATFGVGPTFNDTSLQFGGLYDVDTTAVWTYPHKAHREGINTDLRIYDPAMSTAQNNERRRYMKKTWEHLGGNVFKHSDHYHITYPIPQ